MNKIILFFVFLITIMSSCKKEDAPLPVSNLIRVSKDGSLLMEHRYDDKNQMIQSILYIDNDTSKYSYFYTDGKIYEIILSTSNPNSQDTLLYSYINAHTSVNGKYLSISLNSSNNVSSVEYDYPEIHSNFSYDYSGNITSKTGYNPGGNFSNEYTYSSVLNPFYALKILPLQYRLDEALLLSKNIPAGISTKGVWYDCSQSFFTGSCIPHNYIGKTTYEVISNSKNYPIRITVIDSLNNNFSTYIYEYLKE